MAVQHYTASMINVLSDILAGQSSKKINIGQKKTTSPNPHPYVNVPGNRNPHSKSKSQAVSHVPVPQPQQPLRARVSNQNGASYQGINQDSFFNDRNTESNQQYGQSAFSSWTGDSVFAGHTKNIQGGNQHVYNVETSNMFTGN